MDSILRKSLELGVTTVGILAQDSGSMAENEDFAFSDLIEWIIADEMGSHISRQDGTVLWSLSDNSDTWIDLHDVSRLIHMGTVSACTSINRDQNGVGTSDTRNIYATGDPYVHSINLWRYLKSACQKNGTLTEETVRQGLKNVTVEAAKSLRLSNRGSIGVGYDADLIFVRLDAFGDMATLQGMLRFLFSNAQQTFLRLSLSLNQNLMQLTQS